MSLLPHVLKEQEVVKFINTNLANVTLAQYFAHPQLQNFMKLVREKQEIAAAKEYRAQTQQSLSICHLAVALAQSLTA